MSIERFVGLERQSAVDELAVEEPLEIRLEYGPTDLRRVKSVSVTMRTPGNDFELSAGFLLTEGVIRDASDIDRIEHVGGTALNARTDERGAATPAVAAPQSTLRSSIVCVKLREDVEVETSAIERNFYATSSCGVCGKASLLALHAVCPPRFRNSFEVEAEVLYSVTAALRNAQSTFNETGGLHAVGLFDRKGNLRTVCEDVGRHNAMDKLVGFEFLAERTPLRDSILLLSGRASFELLQKALMVGIPMVVSIGAPSSLALDLAREFDITLVGFLRVGRFNVYHGAARVLTQRRAGE